MNAKTPGKLYLIPTFIGDDVLEHNFPQYNINLIQELHHFIVETPKVARAFIKKCNPKTDFTKISVYELNEHTQVHQIPDFLEAIKQGYSVGLLSDAGTPCMADPGQQAVLIAHRNNIEVIPLIGPSSIYLSLMASGMNGQQFMFHGYLPIDRAARIQKIKDIEKLSLQNKNATQIFIETPYRNNSMIQDLIQTLKPTSKLCISSNIQTVSQSIQTKTILQWKKESLDFHKIPCIYLIQA